MKIDDTKPLSTIRAKIIRQGHPSPDQLHKTDQSSKTPGSHADRGIDSGQLLADSVPGTFGVSLSSSPKNGIQDTGTRGLSFKRHPGTGQYYVRVIDTGTKEVVREVPPAEELDRIARLVEYLQASFGLDP